MWSVLEVSVLYIKACLHRISRVCLYGGIKNIDIIYYVLLGYYRVKYDIRSLKLITSYLNSDKYENIHVLNRAQIVDDTYQFWIQKKFTWHTVSSLMSYLSRETNYVAWYPMFEIFRDLSRFLPFKKSEPIKVR